MCVKPGIVLHLYLFIHNRLSHTRGINYSEKRSDSSRPIWIPANSEITQKSNRRKRSIEIYRCEEMDNPITDYVYRNPEMKESNQNWELGLELERDAKQGSSGRWRRDSQLSIYIQERRERERETLCIKEATCC